MPCRWSRPGSTPSSWVNSSGIPKQLVFGWVGSTGSVTDFHEIDNVVVSSVNPVPQLAVSQTSYAAATLSPGSPVTYTVTASSSGAAENQPVTLTETLPAGVLPVAAYGTGWVCGAPSGQQISCTNSTSPFTSGTITVNGVVTSSSLTPALVQAGSTATASSSDASPAVSSSATAGTVPAAPTVTAITPTNGAAGGANDVKITGTGLGAATAIEIGTTAQFTAGTPTTLVPCAASAAGCFTVVSGTSLDISSMPAHAAGAVTVKVVTLGISASIAYTYNPGPALLLPAPPGGEVNVAYTDQLTVTGGTSPFTWSVSSGSLPPGLTLNASTGLLSGTPTTAGTYSFTVKVTDSSGLSDTEPVTVTIIPGPSMNFAAPPGGWTNTVYGYTLTESGGTAPFTWSVSSGSLPAGISLSPDGNLSGTPTATGTSSFTVKVTDANGQSATQATSITVAAGVSTTFAAPPTAVVNTAYSYTLTAAGGTTPYTWSVNAGTLPAGLTLSSAGVLSGTPTTTGSFHLLGQRDRREQRHRDHLDHAGGHRLGDLHLPGPAVRGGRHGLQRYAHRRRRHHPLHLVDQRGVAPGRPHAERVHRGRVRHPDHGRHLQLHGQGDRRQERDRHLRHLDHHPEQHADRRGDLQRGDRGAGRHGHLHDHRDELGPDHADRGHVHRSAVGCAR